MDSDYPKFLCRPGGTEACVGTLIESGRAMDADDEKSKLADGWYLHPDDFPKSKAVKAAV